MSTTVTQLTAKGMGAIAVLALRGPNALSIVRRLTPNPKIENLPPGKILHTTLQNPTDQTPLDDALIVYVANQNVELHLHGGTAVVAAVLSELEQLGATPTPLTPTTLEEELLPAISAAKTMTAAHLLANQSDEKGGGLTHWATKWKSWLTNKSPNHLWPLHSAAQWLLQRSQTLTHLLTPPRIAIVGPPNAGKSTLANALLGRPVSITSDLPGTTRDWVDAQALFTTSNIQVAVTLIDTAGVRTTTDPLEKESILRTHSQAKSADAIILLFDGSRPPTPEELCLHQTFTHRPLITAFNKIDAPSHDPKIFSTLSPNPIPISAKTHLGLHHLMTATLAQLDLATITPTEPFAFTLRQQNLIAHLARSTTPESATTLLNQLLN